MDDLVDAYWRDADRLREAVLADAQFFQDLLQMLPRVNWGGYVR